ncbi:Velvet complex subunit B-like 1 [Homarus americanus]|uniref:Velvet complex subunit B-like 1 n=1 Tax=Homarus americanus TaxID=6706 RepID=A0A8J5N429_HOMAM|nr:Velvet complex subunit B-like 1 [Homarus americanus]
MSRIVLALALVALVRGDAEADPDYPAARPPTSYGAPPAPSYGAPPAPSYGPPPAPSYGPPPAPSYGPPPAPSYGPPPKPKNTCPKKCYEKTVYTTITNTAKEHHTSWNTKNQYEFVTQPLPDQVIYETKVAYNTDRIEEAHITTVQEMMPGTHYYMKTLTESNYCTNTVQVSSLLRNGDGTRVQDSPGTPLRHGDQVEHNYVTVTEDEPHYVTKTDLKTEQQHMYVTVTETKHGYHTITQTKTEPHYTTVCNYGSGGYCSSS